MIHRLWGTNPPPRLQIVTLLAMVLAACVNTAAAADTYQLDLPAQPLATTLDSVANTSGLKLLYAEDTVRGKQSPALHGRYTAQEALNQALAGSGLAAESVADDMIAVNETAADQGQEPPTLLPTITVTGSPWDDTGYSVQDATTATKTDTPIMETPLSIQVIPQQVLRDQQAYRLQDAVENVSGVQFTPSSGNSFDNFLIRGFFGGFAVTNLRFRNGVRSPVIGKADLANIEQVEVIKGPAAVLYGRLEPGGIINLVTKKPLAEPHYSLQQELGSYDFYRTTADATGPLNADRTLLYRFNLGYLNTDSFRDFVFRDHVLVAPAPTWRPREDTELNLSFEYSNEDLFFDSGIPTRFASGNNRIAPVPITRQYTEPSVNDELESYLVDFNWSHRFNANWILRNGFVGIFENFDFREVSGDSVSADERTVDRFRGFAPQNQEQYSVFADLTGDFYLLGMAHKVLLGADYYELDVESEGFFDSAGLFPAPIDLFNPVYGQVDLAALQSQPPDSFFSSNQSWYGLYFQDQITLWDRVHILGGGRYDWATTGSGFSLTSLAEADATFTERTEEQFSPRVGLVYQPWPWLSLYGNYVESFGANNGRSASGAPFEAQRGEQYEVGVKTEWWDGWLSSTLAFYHLTQDQPADRGPEHPGPL